MDEPSEAAALAEIVLDDPTRDPDSDLSMLARQFLRAQEEIARLRRPASDEVIWRHKARGTTYRIIGHVRVQCPDDAPLRDDEIVLLYQDVHSGHYSARREAEFHDGRFERILPAPKPPLLTGHRFDGGSFGGGDMGSCFLCGRDAAEHAK